ncbi:MAG: hypothetical protein B6I38_10760 [Anaerolineaceae bacterium 4572_5.1]|nr:MAG: hypothetical protein B6I38_10760 [Anaerolineaceae bacterium 4572_5.1]
MTTVKLDLNKKIWPFLIVLSLGMQIVWPDKIWMIFLVGMTGIFILSYFWARSLRKNLLLTREMRFGWSQVGDRLQERFNLSNKGWAPATWIAILDHSDLAGYEANTIAKIGGNGFQHWFRSGVCSRRGLYTIGPTSLRTGDPFGIFTVSIKYLATTNMVVVPPVVALPAIEVAPGGRIGEGVRVVKTLDQTVTASGVREYRPEDSLRFIHWPTTARRDEFFVRTFDSTPASDRWIFLDLFQEAQAGREEQATEEHGIILAASLANRALENGKGVGLALHGETLTWLPPCLEESQKWAIMRALAMAQTGELSLKAFLERTRKSIKHRSSLVIITPDLSGEWLDPLGLLMRRGIVPTVLLIDAAAFGGEGDVKRVEEGLMALGAEHYLIGPEFLDGVETRFVDLGQDDAPAQLEPRKVPWRSIAW